jgi:hypothetical protein
VREGADDCTIQDAEIQGARSVGAMIRVRGHRTTISGCEIHDVFNTNATDGNGIGHQKGEDLLVEDCEIYDCYGDGIIIDDAHTPGPWVIRDNEIYTTLANCSENGIDAKINGDGTVQSQILRNEFYDFFACTGTCGGSGDINGEQLHDAAADPNAQVASMCAIGVNGTDINIWNNTIEDCPEHSLWGHAVQVRIEMQNNIFRNCDTINGFVPTTADYNCWSNCTDTIAGAHDVNDDPLFTNEAARMR